MSELRRSLRERDPRPYICAHDLYVEMGEWATYLLTPAVSVDVFTWVMTCCCGGACVRDSRHVAVSEILGACTRTMSCYKRNRLFCTLGIHHTSYIHISHQHTSSYHGVPVFCVFLVCSTMHVHCALHTTTPHMCHVWVPIFPASHLKHIIESIKQSHPQTHKAPYHTDLHNLDCSSGHRSSTPTIVACR